LIFGDVPVAEAVGALLAHGQTIGVLRWAKGRILSAEDIAAARAAGRETLAVAMLEAGEVIEAEAAARLGAALAGPGVVVQPPAHGRVNLAAAASGVLLCDASAIDALNAVDEGLTLGTLAPFARVAAGEVVATVKIIPYAVAGVALDAAVALARPLGVAAFRPVTIDLIQTLLPGQSGKAQAKTVAVTAARIDALGAVAGRSETCRHDTDALAARLAEPTGAAITLVAGASATVDRRDVVPAAILAAGGRVERLGMPVDPGNLLCLGRIGARAVIGLPGCARSPKRNGFDWVLERLVAGLGVTAGDIALMGAGGLLPGAEPRARL
jgi:molybdenum cofactor cytidylyltransferase